MSNLCAFLLEDALRHNTAALAPLPGVAGMAGMHAGNDVRARPRSPF
jgi:hypothetical protein